MAVCSDDFPVVLKLLQWRLKVLGIGSEVSCGYKCVAGLLFGFTCCGIVLNVPKLTTAAGHRVERDDLFVSMFCSFGSLFVWWASRAIHANMESRLTRLGMRHQWQLAITEYVMVASSLLLVFALLWDVSDRSGLNPAEFNNPEYLNVIIFFLVAVVISLPVTVFLDLISLECAGLGDRLALHLAKLRTDAGLPEEDGSMTYQIDTSRSTGTEVEVEGAAVPKPVAPPHSGLAESTEPLLDAPKVAGLQDDRMVEVSHLTSVRENAEGRPGHENEEDMAGPPANLSELLDHARALEESFGCFVVVNCIGCAVIIFLNILVSINGAISVDAVVPLYGLCVFLLTFMVSQLAPIAYLNDRALKASKALSLEIETRLTHVAEQDPDCFARQPRHPSTGGASAGGGGEEPWRLQRATACLFALGANPPVVDLVGVTVTPFTLVKAVVSAVGGNLVVAGYRALRGTL